MKGVKLFLLVWILFSINFSKTYKTIVSQSVPREIIRGKTTYLTFAIADEQCAPAKVSIFYKTDVDTLFKEFVLIPRGGVYRFPVIPEMTTKANFFYYFLTVECANGKIYGFPPVNPDRKPLRIKIVDKVIE